MALNYIWIAFFLIAFVVGVIKLLFLGDTEVFKLMTDATFDMAKTGFELSIGLTGVMALWLGIMRIGEKGGVINLISKLVSPFFSRIFPGVPKNHPAMGSIVMNFSANFLGLDNAATPIGLKAMQQLQELNPTKDTASNAQIMFLVLNTSGLSLIPLTIMIDRAVLEAANPTDVFLPILLTTFVSSIVGLLAVSIYQRINLLQPAVLAYLAGGSLFIGSIAYYFMRLSQTTPERIEVISVLAANIIIFSIIIFFIVPAVIKKVNVFETFVEGAKEGFTTAIKIIPFLVGILVAIGVFRASGALDMIVEGVRYTIGGLVPDTRFIDALPTAFMKPLSGGAARGMMQETMVNFGADSFVGRLASIFRGATETTFYIIAVYFGSVGIKKTRHAVTCGLIADAAGIIAAIFIGYLFFG